MKDNIDQDCTGNADDFACGAVVQNTIQSPGQIHSYQFYGTIGDVVYIKMSRVNGDLWPQISLYDPNGSLLKSASGISSTAITSDPLPVSGTYSVIAQEGFSGTTGTYNINWVFTNKECP